MGKKRARRNAISEDDDPRGSVRPPKCPRKRRRGPSPTPSLIDSPRPVSEYSPTPSNFPENPHTSPVLGGLLDAAEKKAKLLGGFPDFNANTPVFSHKSLDAVDPDSSPDPDSPAPGNTPESKSSARLTFDADLSIIQCPEVLCVGHSTLPLQSLIQLLRLMSVSYIIDVRSTPVSEVSPQFNYSELTSNYHLMRAKIEYLWLGPTLGGGRGYTEGVDRHSEMLPLDLQNYAAHMTTLDFKAGLADIKMLATREGGKGKRVALMCEEAVHWRCHRRLIADRLVVDNWIVKHMGLRAGECVSHQVWKIARLAEDGEVVYDVPRAVN